MGWDLAILESGNGGDVSMNGSDLAVYYLDENDIYLRMFGGNIEQDTKIRSKLNWRLSIHLHINKEIG